MADKILVQRRGSSDAPILVPATKRAAEALAKYADGDLVIIEAKSKRSEAQNALYWAILDKIAPHMPPATKIELKEQLHVALKLALGRFEPTMFRGKMVPVPKSTADMGPQEFGKYFDDAMNFLCRDVLPRIGDEELTAEVVGMLTPREAA